MFPPRLSVAFGLSKRALGKWCLPNAGVRLAESLARDSAPFSSAFGFNSIELTLCPGDRSADL